MNSQNSKIKLSAVAITLAVLAGISSFFLFSFIFWLVVLNMKILAWDDNLSIAGNIIILLVIPLIGSVFVANRISNCSLLSQKAMEGKSLNSQGNNPS